MSRRRAPRRGAWLLAVHFGAFVPAPLLHALLPAALAPDTHIEAPGTHPPEHRESACPVCRVHDLRPLAGRTATGVPAAFVYASCVRLTATSCVPRPPRVESAAPRAPPAAGPDRTRQTMYHAVHGDST